jgi:hypothetical protein
MAPGPRRGNVRSLEPSAVGEAANRLSSNAANPKKNGTLTEPTDPDGPPAGVGGEGAGGADGRSLPECVLRRAAELARRSAATRAAPPGTARNEPATQVRGPGISASAIAEEGIRAAGEWAEGAPRGPTPGSGGRGGGGVGAPARGGAGGPPGPGAGAGGGAGAPADGGAGGPAGGAPGPADGGADGPAAGGWWEGAGPAAGGAGGGEDGAGAPEGGGCPGPAAWRGGVEPGAVLWGAGAAAGAPAGAGPGPGLGAPAASACAGKTSVITKSPTSLAPQIRRCFLAPAASPIRRDFTLGLAYVNPGCQGSCRSGASRGLCRSGARRGLCRSGASRFRAPGAA